MALCTVSGTFTNVASDPIEFIKVKASIVTPFFDDDGNFISPTEKETVSDEDGEWSLDLLQGSSVVLTFEYPPNNIDLYTDSYRRLTYSIEIPETSTANISDLIEEF